MYVCNTVEVLWRTQIFFCFALGARPNGYGMVLAWRLEGCCHGNQLFAQRYITNFIEWLEIKDRFFSDQRGVLIRIVIFFLQDSFSL